MSEQDDEWAKLERGLVERFGDRIVFDIEGNGYIDMEPDEVERLMKENGTVRRGTPLH